MSNEMKTIVEAIANKKGNIVGVITKQGDLKSGSSDGKDWTKKIFTIEDESGSVEITAWNDEVKLFQIGNTYEIENGWWKEYEGKVGLSIGKYAKVKSIGQATTAPIPEPPKQANITEPEKLDKEIEKLVRSKVVQIAQIEFVVRDELPKYFANMNDQKIGMYAKEIFRFITR